MVGRPGLVKAAQPFFASHKDLRADLYMTLGSEGACVPAAQRAEYPDHSDEYKKTGDLKKLT